MDVDLRDKPFIEHADVVRLNFIRDSGAYIFRRYFRSGLRSHILEVLDPGEVEKETRGVTIDGITRYPLARPLKMLRIFRARFSSAGEALDEIRRLRVVEQRLAPVHLAMSNEFIVDYRHSLGREILLCGFQEFVEGETLDPWSPEPVTTAGAGPPASSTPRAAPRRAESFIQGLKKLVLEDRLIPDLAGARNIIVTPSGNIKLVDINNISELSISEAIALDDRGYPVCDKSIEAMWLLERKLLGRIGRSMKEIYDLHLEPGRMRKVADIDRRFHQAIREGAVGHGRQATMRFGGDLMF